MTGRSGRGSIGPSAGVGVLETTGNEFVDWSTPAYVRFQGPKCRSLGVSLAFDSLCEFVEAGAYVPERSKLHVALALHLLCECSEGGAYVSQRLKLCVALPFYVIWQLGGYSPAIRRRAMRTTHEASSNARFASASV